jgi:hypothetical protein
MDKESAEEIRIGMTNLGVHIGSGIAWFGFWMFLGLSTIDIITTVI